MLHLLKTWWVCLSQTVNTCRDKHCASITPSGMLSFDTSVELCVYSTNLFLGLLLSSLCL
jgi:hypothetical protein